MIDTQGAFDHAAQPHNKEQAQHCAGAHLCPPSSVAPSAARGATTLMSVLFRRRCRRCSSSRVTGDATQSAADDLLGECECKWEKERPRRRAVVRAFLSVARSCSSLNSLSAATVDASSIDHGGTARRRPANDAITQIKNSETCLYTVVSSYSE